MTANPQVPRPTANAQAGKPANGAWIIAGTVLGSGAVFLEGTVVNVGLPAIADSLGLGLDGVQWVVNGFLLTLSALMLLGGSLGDVYGHARIFILGSIGFAVSSTAAAFAPGATSLILLRCVQGATGALLVPNSLAILDRAFSDEQRGAAIGQWAGWSAVSTAAGPLLGGWLVDAYSWRWIFPSVAPFALVAAWIVWRHGERIPAPGEKRATRDAAGMQRTVDYRGAVLITAALALLTAGLIFGPERGFAAPAILAMLAAGVVALVLFLYAQRRTEHPLLELGLFRSRQFTGANLYTLCVYGALGLLFLFLVLQLQNTLGYSALAAGAALLPLNAIMLLLSPVAGRFGERHGARLPMTIGALVATVGVLLLAAVHADSSYLTGVLPGIVCFGLGLGILVAPLTAAVLGAVPDSQTGIASAVNNAAARLAGLITVAAVPVAAGMGGLDQLQGVAFVEGYRRSLWISAGLCVAGAAVAFMTIRRSGRIEHAVHPSPSHACAQREVRATAPASERS